MIDKFKYFINDIKVNIEETQKFYFHEKVIFEATPLCYILF